MKTELNFLGASMVTKMVQVFEIDKNNFSCVTIINKICPKIHTSIISGMSVSHIYFSSIAAYIPLAIV